MHFKVSNLRYCYCYEEPTSSHSGKTHTCSVTRNHILRLPSSSLLIIAMITRHKQYRQVPSDFPCNYNDTYFKAHSILLLLFHILLYRLIVHVHLRFLRCQGSFYVYGDIVVYTKDTRVCFFMLTGLGWACWFGHKLS